MGHERPGGQSGMAKRTEAWVYFNLHRATWSVMERGRVVDHAPTLYLRDATFRVRPGGRARVLREGRKNVHAFVIGTRCPVDIRDDAAALADAGWVRVSYNPFAAGAFVRKDTGAAVVVMLADRSVWALNPR